VPIIDDSDYEPKGHAAKDLIAGLTPEALSKMGMDQIIPLRAKATPKEHAKLAPFEHRAFVREVVQDNPAHALGMAVAIPAYTASKALGITKGTRSKASVEEMKQAFIGLAEGLFKKKKRPKSLDKIDGSFPRKPTPGKRHDSHPGTGTVRG
jgi:hypothetical protein